jgi:hypothetical protein
VIYNSTMADLHVQNITDAHGKLVGVFLDAATFQELVRFLTSLEELQSALHAEAQESVSASRFQQILADLEPFLSLHDKTALDDPERQENEDDVRVFDEAMAELDDVMPLDDALAEIDHHRASQ